MKKCLSEKHRKMIRKLFIPFISLLIILAIYRYSISNRDIPCKSPITDKAICRLAVDYIGHRNLIFTFANLSGAGTDLPKGCLALMSSVVGTPRGQGIIIWNPFGRALSNDRAVREICYISKDPFPGVWSWIIQDIYDFDWWYDYYVLSYINSVFSFWYLKFHVRNNFSTLLFYSHPGLDCIDSPRKVSGPNACEVKPDSKPWIARVREQRGYCGGTLISPSHVVSAAHCFNFCRDRLPRLPRITATLGDHDTRKNESGPNNCWRKRIKMSCKIFG